jgi:predicted nucleic acid-binding protein
MTRGTRCDTGPLVALVNERDDDHAACEAALSELRTPWITTWPCLTEAMYLLSEGGTKAQGELWDYLADGLLHLHVPEADEVSRMRSLMEKYQDAPMDLADASVVAAAETLGIRTVFTIDEHFHAYRANRREVFDVVP